MKKTYFANNNVFPGKKLMGEDRYKRLYHYTSFDSFVKIWLNKNLLFSPITNVNDIQEAFVSSSIIDSKQTDLAILLNNTRLAYKQISFTMDYDSYLKGCMSPMMWGLYADKRKGVCIELDYDKLHFDDSVIKGIVKYKQILKMHHIISPRIKTEKGIQYLIRKSQNELFFTKQSGWAGENEFRVLSKDHDFLIIEGAINAVYLTSCCSKECLLVEKLVNGQVPVRVFHYDRALNNMAIPVIHDTKEFRKRNGIE